jgi:hypothetical protein
MELKEIFGAIDWANISSPTSFGKKVKNMVMSNQIENIHHVNIEGDNHNVYIKQINN